MSTRSVAVAPAGKFAGELHADHFGHEHIDRLAEHDAFGLDAANAPADDAQAVDHGGVAIGADQRVWQGHTIAHKHALGQVLEVHLVDDAGAGRNDAEVVERLLAPAEEFVSLAIAVEFHVDVESRARLSPR